MIKNCYILVIFQKKWPEQINEAKEIFIWK